MDSHLIDSSIYGHLWSTETSRSVFSERSRLARWLDVIAALARAQASLDIIPVESAKAISAIEVDLLDIERIASATRETSHSTLGLIRELQHHLPDDAREHVYFGTTVQDITDTAAVLEIAAIGEQVWTDLRAIEATLTALAIRHRSTPMVGRTHGQPGAPITFGFKVASWIDELGRSIERLYGARDRLLVAQLGGAVGSLGFFGDHAVALRNSFADEVGLNAPTISWLTSRDRLVEFAGTLTLATSALARLANEVFTLQRSEIGEVSEATTATTVGSITMPHKRNPERSEQIVTLSRLVRSESNVLSESMLHEHERDARGWKGEWVTLPTMCHYATACTALTRRLVEGLQVWPDAMLANIHAAGSTSSEQLLRTMSRRVGKHAAQAALQEAYRDARISGRPLAASLSGIATEAELATVNIVDVGAASEMVDLVVSMSATRRSNEPDTWR